MAKFGLFRQSRYVSVNIGLVQLVVISYSKIELSSDVLTHIAILSNQV